MLPARPSQNLLEPGNARARRYVDFAIRDIAAQLDALGAARSETEVKVFGGADVLDMYRGHARPTVGRLNREAAECILHTEGYTVAASRVGGNEGMQIHFNTGTGEVLLRRLGRSPRSAHLHRSRVSQRG